MAAALLLPLKITVGFYRYTHSLHSDGEVVIVGASQRLLLPITAREIKKRERTKQRKIQHILSGPPPPLLHLLWSGLGPSLDGLRPEPSWATGVSTSGDLPSGDSMASSVLPALLPAVGAAIVHRAAPVLPTGIGPLVPAYWSTRGMWVWRAVVGRM